MEDQENQSMYVDSEPDSVIMASPGLLCETQTPAAGGRSGMEIDL